MAWRYQGTCDRAQGRREGEGAYDYSPLPFKYEGQWRQGVKHGQGMIGLPNGGKYTGSFVQGEIQGHVGGTRRRSSRGFPGVLAHHRTVVHGIVFPASDDDPGDSAIQTSRTS